MIVNYYQYLCESLWSLSRRKCETWMVWIGAVSQAQLADGEPQEAERELGEIWLKPTVQLGSLNSSFSLRPVVSPEAKLAWAPHSFLCILHLCYLHIYNNIIIMKNQVD